MSKKVTFVPSIEEKEFIRIYAYTNSCLFPYINTEALLSEKATLGQLRLVAKISKRLQKDEDIKLSIKQTLNDIKSIISSQGLLNKLIVTFPKGLGTYVYDLDKKDFKKLISL